MKLSIVLPVYNEAGNIEELYRELRSVLIKSSLSYEIIAVDDGSKDNSFEIMREIAKRDPQFKIIQFSKNYGQTTALAAGFDAALGEIIMPMDSDLQNDPADIPRFLEEIDKGYDVVSGWRKHRQDTLERKLPSVIANKLISYITGVKLHDLGCMMKAYRKETIKDVRFYGEMHRFIPAYAMWHGAKIKEIVVNHRARIHGVSKYGIGRTFRVILDLLTVKFLMSYLGRPMHFFGWAGLFSLFLSFLAGVWAFWLKFDGVHFNQTPLPLVTLFLMAMGVQFILMGLLAEILVRIYHEPRGRATYSIRSHQNFESSMDHKDLK